MQVTSRLQELDCLRGIAAILVVLFHFTMGNPAFFNIFDFGCTGVELFFLISGFVIFLTLKKTRSGRSFVISRFARIYPTYWVCVTITTAAIILWQFITYQPVVHPGLSVYLLNLTMLQAYFNVNSIDGVYWTLTIELLFYVFMWILLVSRTLHKIRVIGYGVLLFCLLCLLILKPVAPTAYNLLLPYCPVILYFPLFIAGITFYQIKFENAKTDGYLLVLLCLLAQMFFFHETHPEDRISLTAYAICLVLYFSMFILYARNKLGFIVNRVTLFLGRISYSLYLIHGYIAYRIVIPFLNHSRYFHLNSWVIDFAIVLPAVLLLAAFINRYVEVPAMRYIKHHMLKDHYLH